MTSSWYWDMFDHWWTLHPGSRVEYRDWIVADWRLDSVNWGRFFVRSMPCIEEFRVAFMFRIGRELLNYLRSVLQWGNSWCRRRSHSCRCSWLRQSLSLGGRTSRVVRRDWLCSRSFRLRGVSVIQRRLNMPCIRECCYWYCHRGQVFLIVRNQDRQRTQSLLW